MIKIILMTNGKKIATEFEEKNMNLIENSLMVRELEVIKKNLLKRNFKPDWEIKNE